MERIIKKILATTILTLLIVMNASQVFTYAVTVMMRANPKRDDGKTYYFDDITQHSYTYSNSNEGDLYCFQIGAHLNYTGENYTKYSLNKFMTQTPTSTDVANFESTTGAKLKSSVSYFNRSINSKVKTMKAIMWLAKNMYQEPITTNNTEFTSQSSFMKNNLTKIMNKYCGDSYKPSKNSIDININYLSVEQIKMIQQYVFWRFMDVADGYAISNSNDANKTIYNGITNPDVFGRVTSFDTERKRNSAYALYSALCSGAIANANSNELSMPFSSSGNANVTDNSKGKIQIAGTKLYKLGPIKFTLSNLQYFNAKLKVKGLSTTNKLTGSYLADKNGNKIVDIGSNYSDILNKNIKDKDIYIYIKTKNAITESEDAKITLTYSYGYNAGLADDYDISVYYRKAGNETRQPIMEIKKNVSKWDGSTKSIVGTYKGAKIDIALTKEIDTIFRYDPSTTDNYGYKAVYKDNKRLNNISGEEIKMNKSAVTVAPGDIVRYKLTIYNQGSTDAFITQIKDYLDTEGQEYLNVNNFPTTNNKNSYYYYNYINKRYLTYRENTNCMVFSYADNPIEIEAGAKYNIWFECKISSNIDKGIKLINIAALTEYGYIQNNNKIYATVKGIDIDSIQSNIAEGKESNNHIGIYNRIVNRINEYSQVNNIDKRLSSVNGGEADYILEDDEDFEVVKVGGFDLALRKFVHAVYDENGNQVTIASRIPKIYSNTTTHFNDGGTTALYYHKKVPISVKNNYIIRYKIRIYNEGYIPGYATKVVDYLPEGLELIENDSENITNEWQKSSDGRTIYTEILKDRMISPAYGTSGFSKLMNDDARENDTNPGFFKDIILKCKVNYTANKKQVYLTNVAEIQSSKYVKVTGINSNGTITKSIIVNGDRDSSGNNVFTKVSNVKSVDEYRQAKHEGRQNKGYEKGIWYDGDNIYYGVEDDDDFENLIIYNDFDLALRKFIVKVDNVNVNGNNDRTPLIDEESINALKNDSTAIYKHPKNAVEVKNGSIVYYTLRIFNENTTTGVVKEVVDYIPDGMELVAGNGWSYAKVNGQNVKVGNYTKIVYTPSTQITINSPGATGYENLKNKIAISGSNAYSQFNNNTKFWADIPLTCKITSSNDGEILCNIAEITKYGYESTEATSEGIDRDSIQNNVFSNKMTPSEYIAKQDDVYATCFTGEEDDDDFERVKVVAKHEFDLELEKTNENGTKINGSKFEIVQYETGSTPVAAIETGVLGGTTKTILESTETINGSVTKHINEISSNKNYFYKVSEIEGIEGYLNILEGYTILIPVHVDNDENVELTCKYYGNEAWTPTKGFIILDEYNKKIDETDELYNKVSVTLDNNKVKISVQNPTIEGFYRLQIWKKDSTTNEWVSGIKFSAEKIENYIDRNNDGIDDNGKNSTVICNNQAIPERSNGSKYISKKVVINEPGIDKYTITEINDATNQYVELKDPFNIYIKNEQIDGKYKATRNIN